MTVLLLLTTLVIASWALLHLPRMRDNRVVVPRVRLTPEQVARFRALADRMSRSFGMAGISARKANEALQRFMTTQGNRA